MATITIGPGIALGPGITLGTGPATITDPYFSYVTLLLSGDGVNGAQNNTFLDSSANNFSITRNGNTTQGTFSPYGDNWSNYFGSGNYISAASNAAFAPGTGDFTIEAWVNPTSAYTTFNYILGVTGASGGLVFYVTGGVLTVRHGYVADLLSSSLTPALNTWTHVAATRSGTTLRIFVNGVQTASATNSTNFTAATTYVGNDGTNQAPWLGYISNLRLVKGTALYTSNFTPSTTPLTAISGTSLLTCQSNRFVDNSTNNFTITVTGAPSVQRFSPFVPSAAYSAGVTGGSAYFDGSGDYLTAAQNAAFNLGTSAFTVEAWVYITANNGTNMRIIGLGDGAVGGSVFSGWSLGFNNSLAAISWYRYDGAETNLSAAFTFKTNTWYHIVAVRNGTSNLSMFVNGSRVYNNASASLSYNNVNSNPLYVGQSYDGAGGNSNKFFNGYITGARVVKGSAVYDPTVTTIAVPTAPPTAVTNTQLLLNMTNAGITDSTMINNLETIGNAQISTSVKKYGSGSMYFDGTGDWISIASPPEFLRVWWTGPYTLEFWVYANAFSTDSQGASPVIGNRSPTGQANNWSFGPIAGGAVRLYYYNGSIQSLTTATTLSTGQWYHLALVVNNNTITIYINGVSSASAAVSGTPLTDTATPFTIGQSYNVSFNGYIDDLRITRGYARYTSNFTPPGEMS